MKAKKIAVRALAVLIGILAVAGVAVCLSGYPEIKTGLMATHPLWFAVVMLAFTTLILFVGRTWLNVVKETERGPNEVFKRELVGVCRDICLWLLWASLLVSVIFLMVFFFTRGKWLFLPMKVAGGLIVLAVTTVVALGKQVCEWHTPQRERPQTKTTKEETKRKRRGRIECVRDGTFDSALC